jgi:ribulose 1,5-bisphosphate carboxylase large subunit-like protein
MNAELIPKVTEKFGYDYLANVGGAVHSNPNGIKAAVIELRKAIEKTIK